MILDTEPKGQPHWLSSQKTKKPKSPLTEAAKKAKSQYDRNKCGCGGKGGKDCTCGA